ncbi:portal protein [Citrobacter farmeri]|uniref:portal protein n=1 Tax=Citrobacter farmeri TaxID=67824 RepID=UPI0018FF6594|nr:hypothetical protein [Citrobacter farmeri]MBJ9134421.1 hypothetical protein [Citrobacter farmeri]
MKKNKDDIEQALLHQVQYEVSQCESFLDASVRPRVAENWEYYHRNMPAPRDNEPSFVDNTCQATTDAYVASCMDAFTANDTLEIIPHGVSNPLVLKCINQVMNSIFDKDNNRHDIYRDFFMDVFVSGNSILRPRIQEVVELNKHYFKDADPMSITLMEEQLHAEAERLNKKIRTEIEITDKKKIINGGVVLNPELDDVEIMAEQVELYSGYIEEKILRKTIKIDNVKPDNFIINKDARSIEESRIVGHKSMLTFSELLEMGLDPEKVQEVYDQQDGSYDPLINIASLTRVDEFMNSTFDTTGVDNSQRLVEVYELYMRSSVETTSEGTEFESDSIGISKLYRIFYSSMIIMDVEEVDYIPYIGTSAYTTPYIFWGDGMVDRTKDIQRAKTGLFRQSFIYNQMASSPAFIYVRDAIDNERDVLQFRPGRGIAAESTEAIKPIQMAANTGNTPEMLNFLETMRENGTGMSYTGQGVLADALSAGASTISAGMIMSKEQQVQKDIITNLLQSAIIPLIRKVYTMLRLEIDSWHLYDDKVPDPIFINPTTWPRELDIKIKTPLGRNAKIEEANQYLSLFNILANAQPGSEVSKLAKADKMAGLLTTAYELMDIVDIPAYLPDPQQIAIQDQMMQQMQAMNAQMQQMTAQLQQLTTENKSLQVIASQIQVQDIQNKTAKTQSDVEYQNAKMAQMADEQLRKEEETTAKMQNMAHEQMRKDTQTEYEISTGQNLFNGV